MRVMRTPAEEEQIKNLLTTEPTFRNVFRKDWTKNVMDDLSYRMYGRIQRNFLINISGLVGTSTGIFKSTLGLQMALALDPLFSLKQRVAFSINSLLDIVRNNTEFYLCNRCLNNFKHTYKGTYELHDVVDVKCDNCDSMADKNVLLTKMIFFLDEQTRTLKTGGLVRLQNLVDTCRQRQLCFITCGVAGYDFNFMTYDLLRVQESHDDYLPKKQVRYAVYDREREIYYGYFRWDITPLTDGRWKDFFTEYSKLKTEFQRVAISQQTQYLDLEEYAVEIMDLPEFQKCISYRKDGTQVLQSALVKNLIVKKYSDLTNNERANILAEIKMMMIDENE